MIQTSPIRSNCALNIYRFCRTIPAMFLQFSLGQSATKPRYPRNRIESRDKSSPHKASAAMFDWLERGNRVINVSDHRDHLLTRRGGRSKTFSLSFPSIFPPRSSHRTEKGDSRSVCVPLTYPSLTSHHPMLANSLFYVLSSNLRAINVLITINFQFLRF